MTTTVRTSGPKDEHGVHAVEVAAEASMHLAVLRGTLPPETLAVLTAAVKELRWVTESRARWMTACELRQISIHEDERES